MTKRRLRVLAVASHAVQYATPVFRHLAHHPQLDFHVAYCSLRGAEAGHDPEFGEVIQWDVPLLDGYEWTHVANQGSGSESFFGLFNPGLWRVIRKGQFDAVIAYTSYLRATFWIAYLAAKKSGAAFIFGTDATSLAPRDGRGWKTAIKKLVWPHLFRLADQVTAPSEAGFDFMRSLRIPKSRVTLTPFTVDNDWWTARFVEVDRQAVRKSWGVTSDQQVVLFCAKLQPWKRPADLLYAFAHANVEDSVLIFAGTGPLRKWLESEAVSLGIAARVRFLGFVNQSQLPAVYTSADLFVLPSEYDPCPVVVCEALLCGCPVIISDQVRGRFDLIHAGKTGDVFPTGDVEALAGSIASLFRDRANLLVMRNNARERMRTYSPSEAASSIAAAVVHAVSRRRHPSDRDQLPFDGHRERS